MGSTGGFRSDVGGPNLQGMMPLLFALPWFGILAFMVLAVKLPRELPNSDALDRERTPSVSVIVPACNEAAAMLAVWTCAMSDRWDRNCQADTRATMASTATVKPTANAIRDLTDKVIRVDANEGWNKEEALEKINWLADQNVEFVEQPLPAD